MYERDEMQFVLKMTQKCAKCRHVPSDVAVFTEVRKSQLIFCPKKGLTEGDPDGVFVYVLAAIAFAESD